MTGVQTCALPISRLYPTAAAPPWIQCIDSLAAGVPRLCFSTSAALLLQLNAETSVQPPQKPEPLYSITNRFQPSWSAPSLASQTPRVRTPSAAKGAFLPLYSSTPADKRAPGVIDPGGHASPAPPCWHHLDSGPPAIGSGWIGFGEKLPRSRSELDLTC